MPVRQMTEEEKVRFFGSGLVIFGMKRPTPSRPQKSETPNEQEVSNPVDVPTERTFEALE
jgi:hypothetical protein